jgi:hypothetical protein
MTICLGALCAGVDGSEAAAVVAASDRMVTMGGVTEFEHEVPKVTQIGDRIVALAAGDALRGERLVNELRGYLQQGAQPLQSIAATAAAPYAALRRPAGMSCSTAPTPLWTWRPTPLCDGAPCCPTPSIAFTHW